MCQRFDRACLPEPELGRLLRDAKVYGIGAGASDPRMLIGCELLEGTSRRSAVRAPRFRISRDGGAEHPGNVLEDAEGSTNAGSR